MKNLEELRVNIENLTFNMAIGKVTTKNFDQYLYRLGKVVEDLIIYCERRSLKDLEFSYADSDTIHLETRVLKYTPEELAKLFLEHDKNTYRHCPYDLKAQICKAVPSNDTKNCVDCWSSWLTLNYKGEN